jgi:hypothetical protein
MNSSNKAFSLIEVITSAIILSIAVFWVFKLIWENQKLINNSEKYKTANSLFIPLKECIKNIYSTTTIKNTFYINLNNCTSEATETWIILDNIEYILYWSWTTWKNFILEIESWNLILKQEYTF